MGSPPSANASASTFSRRKAKAVNAYLSIAPAAGIKVEEIYRHVLAWKGVVEARQDEDRLARDRPELKETLGAARAGPRPPGSPGVHDPTGRATPGLAPAARRAPRPRRRTWKANWPARAARSGRFKRPGDWERPRWPRRCPRGPSWSTCSIMSTTARPREVKGHCGGRGGSWPSCCGGARPRCSCRWVLPGRSTRRCGPGDGPWSRGTPEPMQTAALELSRRVWEPLKPHLEGATTVLVAPDGPLTGFPLAALPGHRPGTYLVEDLAIGYVSSAHRLVETLAAPSRGQAQEPRG